MNKEIFKKEVSNLGINLTEENIKQFEDYKELLQEYNKRFNLTSITDDENIYLKHFYDSLCLMKVQEVNNSTSLLDIGTGAGFPGIVIAIIKENITVTLVESNQKKCSFLQIVKDKLNLKNIEIINSRAEDYVKLNRNKFDIVTSRAVSHLSVLTEIEIPALKIGGLFLPLKSNVEEELKETKEKLKLLGADLKEVLNYKLPIENSNRTILIIKKEKETNAKYPREYNKIIKEINKKNNSKQ